MSAESRKMAGVLLLPAVMIGGVSILTLLVGTGVVTLRVGLLRTPLRVAGSI